MITPKPVLLVGGTPGGGGGNTPLPLVRNENIDMAPVQLCLPTAAFNYAINEVTGEWEPVQSGSPAADGLVPSTDSNALTIAQLFGFNPVTGNFDRVQVRPNNADALPTQATGNQATDAFLYGYNGTTFDRIRVAVVSKTVIATTIGSTAVWVPTAGKRFRLMGYTIDVAGSLAATGVQTIKLEDAAVVFKNHLANLIQTPSATISGGADHMGADLGQGYLSAAINQTLNINLSVAMGSGGVAINVWGTEE